MIAIETCSFATGEQVTLTAHVSYGNSYVLLNNCHVKCKRDTYTMMNYAAEEDNEDGQIHSCSISYISLGIQT